ncbi:MAG TPA: DUF1990 domain-containing protein [Pyrinomonadaceae bacterium]|nr:DUF1990 domain-containing protein [Pyrinomonadaceae bacterium]
MFLLTRPSDAQVKAFLKKCESSPFSYTEVGTSVDTRPAGYNVDHNRIRLGSGTELFERAKTAIRQWKMFDVPGIELCYPDTPLEPGRNVAPLASHLGFYSLNSCRIVYVIDEPGRLGFAYGTLVEHAEIGEERFMVEYHPDTGEVWYDLFAFSRPGNIFVKLGYPYSRYRQKSFSTGSKYAMRRAVASSEPSP